MDRHRGPDEDVGGCHPSDLPVAVHGEPCTRMTDVGRRGPMRLKQFRHLWGYDKPSEQAFPEIRKSGYAGIEALMPGTEDESRFADLLSQHGLEFIVTVHTHGT